jgi:hypothetical protein
MTKRRIDLAFRVIAWQIDDRLECPILSRQSETIKFLTQDKTERLLRLRQHGDGFSNEIRRDDDAKV